MFESSLEDHPEAKKMIPEYKPVHYLE